MIASVYSPNISVWDFTCSPALPNAYTFHLVFKYCVLYHSIPCYRFRCGVIASLDNGISNKIFLQTFLWQHLLGSTDQKVHSSGLLFLQVKYPANLLPGKSLKNNVNSALLNRILVFELILLSESYTLWFEGAQFGKYS